MLKFGTTGMTTPKDNYLGGKVTVFSFPFNLPPSSRLVSAAGLLFGRDVPTSIFWDVTEYRIHCLRFGRIRILDHLSRHDQVPLGKPLFFALSFACPFLTFILSIPSP